MSANDEEHRDGFDAIDATQAELVFALLAELLDIGWKEKNFRSFFTAAYRLKIEHHRIFYRLVFEHPN